jgi:hypothetical protein
VLIYTPASHRLKHARLDGQKRERQVVLPANRRPFYPRCPRSISASSTLTRGNPPRSMHKKSRRHGSNGPDLRTPAALIVYPLRRHQPMVRALARTSSSHQDGPSPIRGAGGHSPTLGPASSQILRRPSGTRVPPPSSNKRPVHLRAEPKRHSQREKNPPCNNCAGFRSGFVS